VAGRHGTRFGQHLLAHGGPGQAAEVEPAGAAGTAQGLQLGPQPRECAGAFGGVRRVHRRQRAVQPVEALLGAFDEGVPGMDLLGQFELCQTRAGAGEGRLHLQAQHVQLLALAGDQHAPTGLRRLQRVRAQRPAALPRHRPHQLVQCIQLPAQFLRRAGRHGGGKICGQLLQDLARQGRGIAVLGLDGEGGAAAQERGQGREQTVAQ